jgi:F-type H+-transporting ATPase subunit gamma
MAGLKDIKRRIASVKNTKKTTYAMKLVSAAKLKKAQDAVVASRAYTDLLSKEAASVIAQSGDSDFSHPLMEERSELKNIWLVLVGASRGLCGGYNANVNKKIDRSLRELSEKYPDANISFFVLGKKPNDYLRRKKIEAMEVKLDLPESAADWPILDFCQRFESAFKAGEVDKVEVIYTRFNSPVSMTPLKESLLPVTASDIIPVNETEDEKPYLGNTLFEPSPQEVFEAIVPRVMRTRLQQACLDAKAGEHGARMVAMDSATKNAGELIDKLTLLHNKMRQTAITAELLDIVGGAEALSD